MSTPLPAFLIAYSDSSFTNPHEVVRPDEPQACTGSFTHMGAKYWGFETSRHRATSLNDRDNSFHYNDNAYHWLHVGLDAHATVHRVTVSTKWFTGNQVQAVAIELVDGHRTIEVVSRTPLAPDQEHVFDIPPTPATECLVRCFHEGGIARINLFGETSGDSSTKKNLLTEARISHVSNEHYGRPQDAVQGNREVDYMFGWESARSGFGEHALFHLATAATITDIIVDTYQHRLNPPLSCHVFGVMTTENEIDNVWQTRPTWALTFDNGLEVIPDNFQDYMSARHYLKEPADNPAAFDIRLLNQHPMTWRPLVSFGRLRPDTWHHFREMENSEPVSHLLYIHYPNGGIHGLKVYGESAET